MSEIVESNDQGDLVLSHRVIGKARPHARYFVEQDGNTLRLVPVEDTEQEPSVSAEEHVRSFLEWINSPKPPTPILPDEALSRESIYD